MTNIIPTAEPFFFPGKGKNAKIGCLVTHGYTGTPKEMRWLGETLNRQGYTICGIRLTGHATRPEDMIRSRYTDWMASVEDGYHILRGASDKIFLLGLSMGGVLSLIMASRLPVHGVVAMSTPYKLPDSPLLHIIKPLSWFVPYMAKSKEAPDAGWFDKEAFEQHVAYPKNVVRAAAEVKQLLIVMHTSLPEIKVPTLLIYSRDDDYFVDGVDNIFKTLGSTDKQQLWVEGSGHVITEDAKREDVFKAVTEFIKRIAGA